MAWSKEAFDRANELNARTARTDIGVAELNLRSAADSLSEILEAKKYTTGQIREIRKLILQTVRNRIDPLLGQMRDERRY